MSPTTLKVLRPKPLVDGSKFWLLNVTTAGSPSKAAHPYNENYHTRVFVCVSNSSLLRPHNERNWKVPGSRFKRARPGRTSDNQVCKPMICAHDLNFTLTLC